MPRRKPLCTSLEDLMAAVPAEPNKTHLLHHVQSQNWTFLPKPCLAFCCSTHHPRQKQLDTLDWWIQTTEPQISCEKLTSLYLQIHPSGPTGPVQDNAQQCGACAHFGRTPRLFSSTRLRSGLVNRNTLCIRNSSGRGGLKYPAQIQSLEKVSSLLRKKSFQHLREEGRRWRHVGCQTNT